MYRNILIAVALDHSPSANDALEVARALSCEGAQLTALHVVEEIPSYVVAQVPAELLADAPPDPTAADVWHGR